VLNVTEVLLFHDCADAVLENIMQSTVILKASTKARLKLFDRFRANINKLLTFS
jgi:hypothetical protein